MSTIVMDTSPDDLLIYLHRGRPLTRVFRGVNETNPNWSWPNDVTVRARFTLRGTDLTTIELTKNGADLTLDVPVASVNAWAATPSTSPDYAVIEIASRGQVVTWMEGRISWRH